MIRGQKLLGVVSIAFTFGMATAMGQMPPGQYLSYTFDEWGHGTMSVAGTGPLPLFILSIPGTTATDPFSGISTLSYQVPAGTSRGDVLIYGDAAHTELADILRFDGQGHLFFFSEIQPGQSPSPADVLQLPPPLIGYPNVSLTEGHLNFGGMGANYAPFIFQPGGNIDTSQYLFITEVPEPGVNLLLILGGGFGLGLQLKRRMVDRVSI